MLRLRILWILIGAVFLLQSCKNTSEAPKAHLKIAVGQSVYALPEPKRVNNEMQWFFADSIKTTQMIEEAIKEALAEFGNEKPQLLWIMGRAEDRVTIKKAIETYNTQGIPYIFDGSNWNEYTVIGPKGVTGQQEQSFIAVAIGGGADLQQQFVKVPRLKDDYWALENLYGKEGAEKILAEERVKYVSAANDLAKKFDTGKAGTKIYFQMGNLHTPKQNWVLEGISKQFSNLPVIGGAQADWAWQIHNGEVMENSLYGIMITGDFDIAQSLGLRKKDSTLGPQSEVIIKNGLSGLKATPEYAVYFGCAGWNAEQNEQQQVIKSLLPDVIIFGRFNGGEIGRIHNDSLNTSGIDLLSLLLISNRD